MFTQCFSFFLCYCKPILSSDLVLSSGLFFILILHYWWHFYSFHYFTVLHVDFSSLSQYEEEFDKFNGYIIVSNFVLFIFICLLITITNSNNKVHIFIKKNHNMNDSLIWSIWSIYKNFQFSWRALYFTDISSTLETRSYTIYHNLNSILKLSNRLTFSLVKFTG